jgi:hypothetical protein
MVVGLIGFVPTSFPPIHGFEESYYGLPLVTLLRLHYLFPSLLCPQCKVHIAILLLGCFAKLKRGSLRWLGLGDLVGISLIGCPLGPFLRICCQNALGPHEIPKWGHGITS